MKNHKTKMLLVFKANLFLFSSTDPLESLVVPRGKGVTSLFPTPSPICLFVLLI